MRIRIAAIVAALAVGLAAAAAVLLGVSYNRLGAEPTAQPAAGAVVDQPLPLRGVGATATTSRPAEARPASATEPPALPTEADIPATFDDTERADALQWLAYERIVDACMADAGIDGYTYSAYWMPRSSVPYALQPVVPWASTEAEAAASNAALYGNTGGGADYR